MAVSITPRAPALSAPTPATFDYYGASASLSSDGLILVVGEPKQDDVSAGTITDSGAVYTYDWSGSAWVQRGLPLNCPDFTAGNQFGYSVAISGNGLVLVVGAPFQGAGDPGYVYTYDWSGSAWAQRGSAFTHPSDPSAPYRFAQALSLSTNGAVLVVGDPDHYDSSITTSNNIGAAYVYDVSGSTWTQRGSKILAATSGYNNLFGYAVSISGNGLVLAIGCLNEGGTGAGSVYVYDWSGSAWVARGSPIVSPDPARLSYGITVSLSATGAWLLAGASTAATPDDRVFILQWNGSAWVLENQRAVSGYPTGTLSATLSGNALVMAIGEPTETVGAVSDAGLVTVYDIVPPLNGVIEAPTTLTVVLPANLIAGPTTLTVLSPGGVIAGYTALSVIAYGVIEAGTALAVVAPGHIPNWTATCILDGVDISAQLAGTATVQADEGAARVATLSIKPPSGTVLPLDYVGKTITLDYVLIIGGAPVARRLFTGWVDTPAYNPNTSILTLTCVDDLQNRVAALPRTVIDGLIGGRYSQAVQGEILDNWDYAEARLSTVAASLDADASGGMRLTPWEIAATWATLGSGSLRYEKSRVTYPQRSTLINKVDVSFEYRYQRLRQRYTTLGWSGTQIDMAPVGWAYPTQQDILGAASGTGWTATKAIFWPAPATVPHSSGGYIVPGDDAIDMAVIHLTQRHSQTVTESYTLPVSAPESVALNGVNAHSLRASLESKFNGSAWESALDVLPLMDSGGEQDYAPDATRGDSDYAIETLLDQARVKIMGSHRSARVGNAILLNPDLDLDKRVVVDTSLVTAGGKVCSVTHVLDFGRGSAITEFDIACFGLGGAGIITPTPLAPPPVPAEAVDTQNWTAGIPPLSVCTYGITPYNDNIMGLLLNPPETVFVHDIPVTGSASLPNPFYVAGSYPVQGFRIKMSGVNDVNRNPVEKPVTTEYEIIVPSDPITFTIP